MEYVFSTLSELAGPSLSFLFHLLMLMVTSFWLDVFMEWYMAFLFVSHVLIPQVKILLDWPVSG